MRGIRLISKLIKKYIDALISRMEISANNTAQVFVDDAVMCEITDRQKTRK